MDDRSNRDKRERKQKRKEKRFVGRESVRTLSLGPFVYNTITTWHRVVAVKRPMEGQSTLYLQTLLDEFSEVVKRRNVHAAFTDHFTSNFPRVLSFLRRDRRDETRPFLCLRFQLGETVTRVRKLCLRKTPSPSV